MEWALMWFVGSVMVGAIANEKGLNWWRYLLASLVLSPIVVGIVVIAVPSKAVQKVVFADEVDANKKSHLTCPRCAEFVKLKAQVCRYCGCDLGEEKRKLFDAADAQDRAKKIS